MQGCFSGMKSSARFFPHTHTDRFPRAECCHRTSPLPHISCQHTLQLPSREEAVMMQPNTNAHKETTRKFRIFRSFVHVAFLVPFCCWKTYLTGQWPFRLQIKCRTIILTDLYFYIFNIFFLQIFSSLFLVYNKFYFYCNCIWRCISFISG